MADLAASVLARLKTKRRKAAEAISCVCSFSARKNFCGVLAQRFDFDGVTLTEALRKTFENRGHDFTVERFDLVMDFGCDDTMQKKWKAFCRKVDIKTDGTAPGRRTLSARVRRAPLRRCRRKMCLLP